MIQAYDIVETDGSRMGTEVSKEEWKPFGRVMQISKKARKDLEDEMMDVTEGDLVWINPRDKHHGNWFIPNRETPSADWDGLLILTAQSIQARHI